MECDMTLRGAIAVWFIFLNIVTCTRAIEPAFTLISTPFEASSNLTDLTLVGLQPYTGEAWPAGDALLPPMRWALEDIGERNDILHEYRLILHLMDSKVGVLD